MDADGTSELGAAKVPLVSNQKQQRTRRTPRKLKPSRLQAVDFRSVEERMDAGRALRKRCPRSSHAAWKPFRGRDPLAQLKESDATRLPWLVPVRHERMSESTRDLIVAMDGLVWTVDPTHDSLDHLASHLARLAGEMFRDSQVRCRLDIPPLLPAMPIASDVRHHIAMAV
ncbi:MAG: hypothetical protein EOO39_11595, partial [Cytophagaceae bacterium]